MMRKALLLAVLLAAGPARAQSDEYQPGPWYGWQLILADAAAVTMMTVPVSPGAGPITRSTGVTAFFMNGPTIHMAHRNPRSASISLMRLPLLLVGGLAGVVVGGFVCSESGCQETAFVLGEAIGVAPVLLHDWLSARRPARSYYASDRPLLPAPRLQGWAAAVPVLGGVF
jgi:hypothetical protein